jgi:hypothetical protein
VEACKKLHSAEGEQGMGNDLVRLMSFIDMQGAC